MRLLYIMYSHIFLENCVWGPWTEYSNCDKSCGGGKMSKTRTKLVVEDYGGICYGWHTAEMDCNTFECKFKS